MGSDKIVSLPLAVTVATAMGLPPILKSYHPPNVRDSAVRFAERRVESWRSLADVLTLGGFPKEKLGGVELDQNGGVSQDIGKPGCGNPFRDVGDTPPLNRTGVLFIWSSHRWASFPKGILDVRVD